MIETHALSKRFPRKGARGQFVTAIHDVGFTAQDGRITGLLGPNGAGKSTTLRILAGLLLADTGSARIDGHDVEQHALAARRRIGFLPHNAGLYPRLTAQENLVYYAELCGLTRHQALQRSKELVELLDMQEFAQRRCEGFSQGQRTRVALGRALIHRPGNLILDEPSNGLDVMANRKLRGLLRRLRDEGHCVLISSHIMQEVALLSDHVAIIHDGRIALSGSTESILESTGQDNLEDAFVVAIGETPERVS